MRPGERDNARNNARCTKARKPTLGNRVCAGSGSVYMCRRGSSILIGRALPSDSGEYWCQAVNAVGTATGTPFSVTVDPPGTVRPGILHMLL